MDTVSIAKELFEGQARLKNATGSLFKLSKEYAEAEKFYRQKLQIEIVKLKDAGMSVTLIPDIARGRCADEMYNRDLAEFRLKVGRDSVEAIKSQLSVLQTLFNHQSEI